MKEYVRWSLLTADSMAVILVGLALQVLTLGIASSLQNADTRSFFIICFLSAAISYGLGKLSWNGIQASVGMAVLGVLHVWILGAHLMQPLLTILTSAWSILPQLIPAIQNKANVDLSAINEVWRIIVESSAALWMRILGWIPGFNRIVTINDVLIRNMFWGLILWLCAAWMGWFAKKRNAVASLLPAMILLSLVISYCECQTESLWVMLVLLLLLMGIWDYRNHTLQWQERRIDFSDSIRTDNSQAVIFLTIAIGTFAFITPSISWRDIMDHVRERQQRNETAEMLGVQPPESGKSATEVQPVLPRDYLLGGAAANSEKIVITIRTGELPPIPQEFLPADVPRYYWRSIVYDRYVGTGWATSTVFSQSVSANAPLIPGLLKGYRLVHLNVKMVEPDGRLFWNGVLFSVDIPYKVSWRLRPPSDLFADQQALLLADMFTASTSADSYQAEIYVPALTISELRNASANYPDEIRTRYLSLPSTMPNRVQDLARHITEGLINPYDKAKAIESYLRTNYPYTLDIPPLPDGYDVADYFLFDLKKGYCDYYATAMVVLLRSSGVPARFVSGYSPGAYDASNAQYIIRELNAHSWVDVYFPEIGWVEFEPTASQPEIERTEKSGVTIPGQGSEQTVSKLLTRFRMERILLWSSPVLVILLAVIFYYAFIDRLRILRLAPQAALENLYQRFYEAGRPFAGEWTRAETSSEFLQKVTSKLQAVQQRTGHKALMIAAIDNAIMLTELYNASLFTNQKSQKHDALLAWQTWSRLRRQLLRIKVMLKLMRNASDDAS